MSPAPRRSVHPLVVLLMLAAAGCGAAGPSPEATIGPPATAESGLIDPEDGIPGADAEDTPGGAGSSPPGDEFADPERHAITTEWGRLWDRVPDDFPIHPDGYPADDALPDDPVSAVYAVDADDVAEIVSWMQAALEEATYSTEALSGPLDDGTYAIDSVGDAGCRIEVTIAPLDGLALVTVRYGAECPND